MLQNDEKAAGKTEEKELQVATLAGGCFWCTEAVYLRVKGVKSVKPGYTGGTLANPTYKQVCSGYTGHAEAVQIQFDPDVITYKQLLEIFFYTHDPTTLNRQGADVGTQYRSAVFFHNDEQKEAAQAMIDALNRSGDFDAPIVTTLEKFEKYYVAEVDHHNYFELNPGNSYCQFVVGPKVTKFEKRFKHLLKKDKEE